MGNIDWSKLKNGGVGFEDLAREYVKKVFEFPNGDWKETPPTHDGGKDAYTIIIGFHPELTDDEVWWMEAKYSTSSSYLSRFRLDATIVSSIFNRSIKKIIFITNIDIKAKVISDIRTALYYGTTCKETHFCTKKTLEFWLHKNPSIYHEYFKGELPEISDAPDLFISEDVSIYSVSNAMRQTESLSSIVTDVRYEAHLKIISNCEQEIKITKAQKGIKRVSKLRDKLHEGENTITIDFIVERSFLSCKKRNHDQAEENNLCFFKLNDKIPVLLKHPITILNNFQTQLMITSQQQFESAFEKLRIGTSASYWMIDGKSGSGKTTVVKKCIENSCLYFNNYRYTKFVYHGNEHCFEILATLFFIIFPYMYIHDITPEYMESLVMDNELKNKLIFFQKNSENEKALYEYINKPENHKLFPENWGMNGKIIVFDDVQYLNKRELHLLFYLLRNCANLPVVFVLIGQEHIWEQSDFLQNSVQFVFEKRHFELNTNDIVENLQRIFDFSFDITDSLLEYFFPNIIIFNIYVNYIRDLRDQIHDINDFILTYISFKQNYMSNEYINRQFLLISEKYPEAWSVCREIYSNVSGIPLSKNNENQIKILLKAGLIKYNEYNYLIPIHDIYSLHYRKRNPGIATASNLFERMIKDLTTRISAEKLEECYTVLHKMREQEEFRSINYILETVFENESAQDDYRKLWGDEVFYLIYFEYTYASINSNSNITGYDNLQFIYKGIKGKSSVRLNILLLEVIFELINCEYNNGNYSACRNYFEIFKTTFSVLSKKGLIDAHQEKNLFWVLSKEYILLIDAEEDVENALQKIEPHKDFLKNNYFHHYIDFCYMFSKVMYVKDFDAAYEYQKLAFDEIKVQDKPLSKQTLKVSFKFYFTQYLRYRKAEYLTKMHEQMKLTKEKVYSVYRHQLFNYCALLYILGSVEEADTLLLQDVVSLRPIRKKMKGHYYLLLSLHYLKNFDIEKAMQYTQKSKTVFGTMETYLQIPRHNEKVLERVPYSEIRCDFYCAGKMNSDVFYLDPRM